ncbi:MAG: putative DNA-binding domain-containing protein [Myxococcota bacterium]
MLSDRIATIQRVCFSMEPSESDLEALGSRERWLVYRSLVRQRLVNVVGVALSRTKSAVGADEFQETVDAWLAEGGPATRYFRHVPQDFASHAAPRWGRSAIPWLAALADYEITSWDVRYAPSLEENVGEFAFDGVPVLNPALAVLRLDYPVHQVPTPSAGYSREETRLCVYRDSHHKPVPWSLNPIAASLVERWARADKTVAETVQEVAADHGVEIGPTFVDKLSGMVADFLTRGIILGARAADQ